MELKITKEKVLEAASKCSTAKATLQTLFPEVFEDGIAIRPGAFSSKHDPLLQAFCEKAFGENNVIQITDGAAINESHKYRSLFVQNGFVVEVVTPTATGRGTIIVIKKK